MSDLDPRPTLPEANHVAPREQPEKVADPDRSRALRNNAASLAAGGEGVAADPKAPPKWKFWTKAKPAVNPDAPPPEPRILGETKLDRASSALMSFIIGTGVAVAWVGLMVYTQQSFAERPPALLEIIEVSGGGGGSPDANPGDTENVEVSAAEVAEMASNNMEDATQFEEPTIEQTSAAVIDALADVPPDELANVDIADALPNAELVATGIRASKVGTGQAFGFGTGSGNGVSREQRWSFVFPPGQTLEEYARQLDFLGVELATPDSGGTLVYAKNFSASAPLKRSGLAGADKRLYFLWQGAGRKGTDLELLQKAGISVGNKPIFQFYPKEVEDQLAQLEVRFAGRQPAQIRKTRFQVVPSGGRYEVKVLSQEPLG